MFLEVRIAILQVVFKCPSPAGEGPLEEPLEGGGGRRQRAAGGGQEAGAQERGGDLRRGLERAGREAQRDVDVGAERVEHGQDPVLLRPGRGGDAARDLVLQHHVHVAHAVRQVEEAAQQRARDVVGQVADEAAARGASAAEVGLERVALDEGRRSPARRSRSRAASAASSSTATTRPARAASGSVSAPRPPDLEEASSGRGSPRAAAARPKGHAGSAGRGGGAPGERNIAARSAAL